MMQSCHIYIVCFYFEAKKRWWRQEKESCTLCTYTYIDLFVVHVCYASVPSQFVASINSLAVGRMRLANMFDLSLQWMQLKEKGFLFVRLNQFDLHQAIQYLGSGCHNRHKCFLFLLRFLLGECVMRLKVEIDGYCGNKEDTLYLEPGNSWMFLKVWSRRRQDGDRRDVVRPGGISQGLRGWMFNIVGSCPRSHNVSMCMGVCVWGGSCHPAPV